MTETSFQECRKVMQKANWLRGKITDAKGDVAKWTKVEQSHRENMRPTMADGAKKILDKALAKLEEWRKKFAELEFPESNLPPTAEERCAECGVKIKKGEEHVCEEKLHSGILDSNPKAFR